MKAFPVEDAMRTRRYLPVLALLVLAACSTDSKEEEESYDPPSYFTRELTISTVDRSDYEKGPYVTGCSTVKLSGWVFCCPQQVSWSNDTLGQAGAVGVTPFCMDAYDPLVFGEGSLCGGYWSAEVPLDTGANAIALGATEGLYRASVSFSIERVATMPCTAAAPAE